MTFHFGQPDPKDASHFTIEVVCSGKTATIHGRLMNDNTVDFKLEAHDAGFGFPCHVPRLPPEVERAAEPE